MWFYAVKHCEGRGARLPTEAEWEYAARGPDGLVYPWGNDFVADNVVYSGNSNNQTWDVGSKPDGVSWVGAFDLSGNVWEWVNSLYRSYPYDATDGRVVDGIGDPGSDLVLRGGPWYFGPLGVRAANRGRDDRGSGYDGYGFRCARSD